MPLTYVVIPRGQIKILGDGVMVITFEPSHHVRGDELLRIGIGSDDI
jgi:hypothetical protein